MDWGDIFIEKLANQFLEEGKEIENGGDLYTTDYYILFWKDVPADFMNSFDQSKHDNYH